MQLACGAGKIQCGTESGDGRAPRSGFRRCTAAGGRLRFRLQDRVIMCTSIAFNRIIVYSMLLLYGRRRTCHRSTRVVQHTIITIIHGREYVIFGAHDCCDTQSPSTVGGKLPSRVDEPLLYIYICTLSPRKTTERDACAA